MVKKILISLLMKLMSEEFAKEIILMVAKWLVGLTKNKYDDEFYKAIENALNK